MNESQQNSYMAQRTYTHKISLKTNLLFRWQNSTCIFTIMVINLSIVIVIVELYNYNSVLLTQLITILLNK